MDNNNQHLKVTTELRCRASPSFYTSFIDIALQAPHLNYIHKHTAHATAKCN